MRSPLFVPGVIALLVGVAWAEPAAAQFRNNGIQLHVGYLGLGSLWDRALNGGQIAEQNIEQGTDAAVDPGWNMADQPTVGVSYYRAIGYQTWWDNQVALGAWTTIIDVNNRQTPVITTSVSSGLRYNFLEERHRPFVAAHIHYLQLFALGAADAAPAPVPGNQFLGNNPFFIGFRPGVGYEFIFGDEQAVQIEVNLVGFLVPDPNRGLNGLFLPATVARFGYNIYF
jgi:hypothetical protein